MQSADVRGAALLAALALALPGAARAQQVVTQASVSGTVQDPGGGALEGVVVSARDVDRGQAWTAATDARGRYRFLALPVGAYELRAEHPSFRAPARRVTLTVGQVLDVPFRMDLAGGTETVDVESEAPMLETVRTQIADTIGAREIEGLPLAGRNYLDLAALVPAVTRSNPVSNQRFPETGAVPGTGLSVTGQRQINNTFVVDGLSGNDDAADLPGTFYSQEVIREFQVVTSGGIAEFGRASAGIVNILTRSGSNRWQGRGYGFLRDDALDAKNPLAAAEDPLRQWQYGGTAGGPLVKDRTFLFANVEQTRLDSSSVITIRPADAAAVNAALLAAGHPGPAVTTGSFATGHDATNLFLRLDHRLSEKTLLTARYSLYDIGSDNARNVGGLNAISRGTALANTDHTLAVNAVVALAPLAVNETRVQLTRSRLSAPPNDLAGPAVNVSGVASLGTATFSPVARDIDLLEVANVTTVQRGAHALKAGADLLYNRVDIAFPGAVQGVYTFSSLDDLRAGRYVTFQQAFGEEDQHQDNPNLGLFVQDEWRVSRDLTLNGGLRYDLQMLNDPIRTDTDNVSPRLGVAWAPGDGRMVVRAGGGLFFDRLPLRAISNALQRDGTKYRVAVMPFGTPGAPSFPHTLDGFPSGLLASITTVDPAIENAQAWQWSAQVERALSPGSALAVGYLGVRAEGLIVSRNVNVPTAPAGAGVPNLGRPDPRHANVSRFESLGRSRYDGLTVSLRQRLTGALAGRVSYTLSRASDDAGNAFFFTPQDNADLAAEWGPSDNDQRHRLVVSATLDGPDRGPAALRGWTLGGVFSCGSALPFNVLFGADRNGDTNVNDRPAAVGRNSGRGFSFASLDLRLGRRFGVGGVGVEALIEGFNVLNRANYQLPDNTFGPGPEPRPGFGSPTAAADPRTLQVGLRIDFQERP